MRTAVDTLTGPRTVHLASGHRANQRTVYLRHRCPLTGRGAGAVPAAAGGVRGANAIRTIDGQQPTRCAMRVALQSGYRVAGAREVSASTTQDGSREVNIVTGPTRPECSGGSMACPSWTTSRRRTRGQARPTPPRPGLPVGALAAAAPSRVSRSRASGRRWANARPCRPGAASMRGADGSQGAGTRDFKRHLKPSAGGRPAQSAWRWPRSITFTASWGLGSAVVGREPLTHAAPRALRRRSSAPKLLIATCSGSDSSGHRSAVRRLPAPDPRCGRGGRGGMVRWLHRPVVAS